MKKLNLLLGILIACLAPSAVVAGTVTNNTIFGSGNTNEAWTITQANGIELGLRAKVRFNDTGSPENTYNWDGGSTYTHLGGQPPVGGFGFAPGSSSTARWNFEWSINSDYLDFGLGGAKLSDLVYQIDIDFDETAGVNFQSFDLINVPFADHAIGDNLTGPGGGTTATDATDYATLIQTTSLAQNSWNMEFFDVPGDPNFSFNANQGGIYTIRLSAFSDAAPTTPLAQTEITVNAPSAVPEPATLLSFALITALPLVRRRSRR